MTHQRNLAWHINSLGLSDVVMNDLLKMANISQDFMGIFPFDQLNRIKEIPAPVKCCYTTIIINVGGHFVMICFGQFFTLYVDSFGKPIERDQVYNFIRRVRPFTPFFYNSTQVQSLQSTHCGLYAVLFSLFFDRCQRRASLIGRQQNIRSSRYQPYSIPAPFVTPPKTPFTMYFSKEPNQLLLNDELCISYIQKLAK